MKVKTRLKQIPPTALLLAFSLNACTVEKRIYSAGYHIEWHRNKHNPAPSPVADSKPLTKNQTTDTPAIAGKSLHQTLQPGSSDEGLTASSGKWSSLPQKKLPVHKALPDDRAKATPKASTHELDKRHDEADKGVQAEDPLKKQKNLLSTLWTFVTLNYLYCDLVGLMDAGKLSQYLLGTVDGLVISQGFLLGATIFIEIPMIMILLSRVLKGKGNRNANIIAGIIMTVVQLATLFLGPVSMYYLFFNIIEIATTAFIVWYAWKKFPNPAKV